MANMKVVSTEWTGSCVIACDCGSEEPVEGTIHRESAFLLEDEIKKLRQEVSILKRQSATNYDEWEEALEVNAQLKKQIAKDEWVHEDRTRAIQKSQLREDRIEQLEKYISTWKDLWMTEREHNKDLRERFERQFDVDLLGPTSR